MRVVAIIRMNPASPCLSHDSSVHVPIFQSASVLCCDAVGHPDQDTGAMLSGPSSNQNREPHKLLCFKVS